ncbi:ureidoglycolate lyase [Cellulosilyticum sp. I15G10I2]|uniref:ureidoglycolate lyase n=1 Tax=Cellulosilyticum sp. I15G10I2 TaxID=1892843 RepID=UPI00085C7136|nr:ureidoglycolate lyase [Cellulosilyticum sp. I15G10I2]
MRKIQAKPISAENFKSYGSFYSITHPTGHNLGDFYHDHVLFPVSGDMPIAFSALVSKKPEKMIVTAAEYHNTTAEGVLPLDADVILHVAPPSNKPVPELTEAFIVPMGTMVKLNTGVWHLAALPIDKEEVHVLIVLPERIYFNDCTIVEYATEDQIEIEL